MMVPMSARFVKQVGLPFDERIVAVEGRGRPLLLQLRSGERLVDALARAFDEAGFLGGVVDVGGLELDHFSYVMPALSKDGANAAFYSDVYQPAGVIELESGRMSFGRRDDAPFFHCHALWPEPDGQCHGGHILPDHVRLAFDQSVHAYGFDGGVFEANPDRETNFKLFGPVPAPSRHQDDAQMQVCHLLRLRPNQDLHGALEAYCAAHGFGPTRILGGVGSTIAGRFEDGTILEPFATEVYIREGHVSCLEDGSYQAHIDVGYIDYTGQIARGPIMRGDSPVLMTFELMLCPGLA